MRSQYSLMLVLFIAAMSSLFFSSASIFTRAGLKHGTPLTALWVSLMTNVIILWAISFYMYGFVAHFWQWRYFILAGLFAPLLGRMFRYRALDFLGVNISSPIVQVHPFVAIILAIVFLGEHLSIPELLGGLLAIFGSVLVGTAGVQSRGDSFSKKYLLLPIFALLCYAISTIFRRIGIQLGTPAVTASAVTVTTSWLVLTAAALVRPKVSIFRASRQGIAMFICSGLVTTVAVPLYYLALHYGNVVLVMPVIATQAIFTLGLSFLFLRHGYSEIFNLSLVAGTASVTLGVALLGIFGSLPH